jgi:hypothetical protein
MILYLFLAIVLIILMCVAYIRLKFKFWADQPVMHFYDVQYWFKNKGIIDLLLPEKNKYCNFKNILTREYSTVSEIQLTTFINLVQNNYLRNKDNMFLPLKENIVPYFTSHSAPCFWTFYWEEAFIQHAKDGSIVKDRQLIGAMTSRPLNIVFHNGDKNARLTAYYVDYLCVDRRHRKKGIAPEIIQTHEYNQRHANKKVSVSLFKREEELTGIIPMCFYQTVAFSMKGWCKPSELEAGITVVKCGKENIAHLIPLIFGTKEENTETQYNNTSLFEITILPELGNLMELIKTENMFVFILIQGDNIIGAYFFRKTCLFIEKGAEALALVASIYNPEFGPLKEEFVHGYKIALADICTSPGSTYKYAVVENISHNNLIIDNLMIKNKPYITSPTAYFFYNFAHSTFQANQVLLIC